ncbi:MAG: anaerobic ribonucleoside-triphosphate reductase activating protein [Blautia sp.]|nr:anaerobic ribonucleoside-triphosphate reductase activating protein [Blautia sp.]
MNYAAIKFNDIANGLGCRTSLFVSGCTHHCPECFNQQAWDFSYGSPFTEQTQDEILASLMPSYISGLTILGGEPMEIVNQEALLPFLCKVRDSFPGKTIWIYSGYTWEELMDESNHRCHGPYTRKILSLADILVDGEFQIARKNIALAFRGSENQRIIDIQKSLRENAVIPAENL